MKTADDEAALFRAECLKWQGPLNLRDWRLQFKTAKATQGANHEADVDFDCDTRHATVTYNIGVEDAYHPSDVALHEMLHLLLADMVVAAISAKDESCPVLARAEHRVVEVLLKVITEKK